MQSCALSNQSFSSFSLLPYANLERKPQAAPVLSKGKRNFCKVNKSLSTSFSICSEGPHCQTSSKTHPVLFPGSWTPNLIEHSPTIRITFHHPPCPIPFPCDLHFLWFAPLAFYHGAQRAVFEQTKKPWCIPARGDGLHFSTRNCTNTVWVHLNTHHIIWNSVWLAHRGSPALAGSTESCTSQAGAEEPPGTWNRAAQQRGEETSTTFIVLPW